MKTIEKIFDVSTGEETFVERDLTKDEIAQIEKEQAEAQKLVEQLAIKAAAKAALLERLGITEEEAKLLLG